MKNFQKSSLHQFIDCQLPARQLLYLKGGDGDCPPGDDDDDIVIVDMIAG